MSDLLKKASHIAGTISEKAAVSAGNFVEHSLGNRIEKGGAEAPVMPEEPEKYIWYRIPIDDGMAGDGSGYHIYVRYGADMDRLCIFFSGGGVAWNEKMAKKPVTGGRVAAWKPNYYWNNLRPFTQIMNINVGITDTREQNPFYDWNMAVITYATGDFHLGSNVFLYSDDDGIRRTLHFVGHDNFRLAMERISHYFKDPQKLLLAGDSAGAFATPALAPEVIEDYYPNAKDVTLFSDSALLLRAGWKETIREMWGAPSAIYNSVHSSNITADWYEDMTKRYGDRCRYLYASSIHDYLLSAFINEEESGEYYTDEATQKKYADSLKIMCERMASYDEPVRFFIYDYRMPVIFGRGGTIHTAVRSPHFYLKNREGLSMSQWLFDAVEGRCYDVGLDLL